MTAPSLTLRTVQNEETGIDISVPRFQEEEAPLGGVSILYEISVLTSLELFKSRLHRNEDVVQFSVYKAYREIEDFYIKVNKKYPKAGLPPLPKYSTIDKYTSDEKVEVLDRLMRAVAKNVELCHSSAFTHFIGINSQRLPSFTVPSTNSFNIDSKSDNKSDTTKPQKNSADLSEVFPKVNIAPKAGSKTARSDENIDLFEEVKQVKDEKSNDVKRGNSTGGLFDDFEDDSLFNTPVMPKPVSQPKQENKNNEIKPERKKPEIKKEPVKKTNEAPVDDSEIIIKERKLGNISLFDEQDLGDYITKDEEALFLVDSKSEDKSKNNLLFSSDAESTVPNSELNEDLDDLLNLNPLPISPAKTPQATDVPDQDNKPKELKSDASEAQPKRPVPLPRKKSLGKIDIEEQKTLTRPEVAPRRVFLTNPEVPTEPVLSSQEVNKRPKPPVSAKPALPKKPKPPPKPTVQKDTKDLDAINANEPAKLTNSVSSVTEDLNKLDILKYIEQEQKALDSKPSLFD